MITAMSVAKAMAVAMAKAMAMAKATPCDDLAERMHSRICGRQGGPVSVRSARNALGAAWWRSIAMHRGCGHRVVSASLFLDVSYCFGGAHAFVSSVGCCGMVT